MGIATNQRGRGLVGDLELSCLLITRVPIHARSKGPHFEEDGEKKRKERKKKEKKDETNLNGGRICVLHDIQRFFFLSLVPCSPPSLSRSGGWKVGEGAPLALSSLSLSSLSQNLNTFSGEGREGWQRTVTVS